MFFVRYQNTSGGAFTTLSLMPGPTDVEYPDARLYKPVNTQDGAVVVQRPLRDDRPRKWIWKGYRDSDLMAAYKNQWATLSTLEYRYRLQHNLPATVQIWEDETGIGGFNLLDGGGAKIWTTVKFLQVQRTIRPGGGFVIYDASTIEFVIADNSFSSF